MLPLSKKIEILLNEHTKLNNLALDWLIASWTDIDEDKIIDLAMYRKYKKKVHEVTKRLVKLV